MVILISFLWLGSNLSYCCQEATQGNEDLFGLTVEGDTVMQQNWCGGRGRLVSRIQDGQVEMLTLS